MTEALAHRGPDDAQVHLEPTVGLGFRRLAIIDLDTGEQPLSNEDGSIWVTLNGEIYNYRELGRSLRNAGHRFSTKGDAEVLVHLYEELGRGLVDELRGMFAFALWDRGRSRLILARDHLGQKPLYWARNGGRFWFASEIKAILAAAPGYRQVNPQALHEYFTLRVISGSRSMFQGVEKLRPGHLLEVNADGEAGIAERRYWSLSYEPKPAVTLPEAVDELDEAVTEAVRLHLVSDVEVGAFLSGGIDSGLVTAITSHLTNRPFKTFSGSTPYGEYDEGPAARLVAERYGTDHFETPIVGDSIGQLPLLVYHLDEPSDPLSVCVYLLSELTSRHVKVALGGDGGDELFGGYDRYYGTEYARYFAALPGVLRRQVIGRMVDLLPGEAWYKSLKHQLNWLLQLAELPSEKRYPRTLGYFYFTPRLRDEVYSDSFHQATRDFDPEVAIAFWQRDENVKASLDGMLLADSMVRLPNHSVMILDRMTMAHGLEARSPFLDHRLAEFAATLPARFKVRGRKRRVIEYELARRYLPEEVCRRPKQGFNSALPYMMGTQFRRLFEHFLRECRLVGAGFLRKPAIERMLADHLSGTTDHGNRLWLLLNAEIWYRVHIEAESVDGLVDEIAATIESDPGSRPRSRDPEDGPRHSAAAARASVEVLK